MKNSLVVKICTGTACYVQGGSFLLDLESQLSPDELSCVDIIGVGCLGICGGTEQARPPFALVGDTLMSGVGLRELTDAVRGRLETGGGADE